MGWGKQDWKEPPKRCYETHPALKLNDGLVIYGGSCGSPIVEDADIYVGFDYSMAKSPKQYPWVQGESFLFPIQDMHAPSDPVAFKQLIEWTAMQVIAKKKVHMGCIGGHGRTGTVFAALVAHMMGRTDAIQYVRENYCVKAVESKAQVEFLKHHYGVEEAVPAKAQHAQHHKATHSTKHQHKPQEALSQVHVPQGTNPLNLVGGGQPVKLVELTKALPAKNSISVWSPEVKVIPATI